MLNHITVTDVQISTRNKSKRQLWFRKKLPVSQQQLRQFIESQQKDPPQMNAAIFFPSYGKRSSKNLVASETKLSSRDNHPETSNVYSPQNTDFMLEDIRKQPRINKQRNDRNRFVLSKLIQFHRYRQGADTNEPTDELDQTNTILKLFLL